MLTHRVLFEEQTIAIRVQEMARAIAQDLPEPTPILIGLLTGAFIFLADLMRALGRLGIEPQVDFMAVSHYGPLLTSSGLVQIHKDSAVEIKGRPVLLVDDILDSGQTLSMVRDHLAARGPSWLRTCVLLDKPSRREIAISWTSRADERSRSARTISALRFPMPGLLATAWTRLGRGERFRTWPQSNGKGSKGRREP